MKNHPDKGGDQEKFKDVAEAYEVLSNADKRAQYDNPQQAFQFNGGSINPEEIFKNFFGGHPAFGMPFGHSHVRTHMQSPFGNVHVVNIAMPQRQNLVSRSTQVSTQGNIRIEKITEVRNGITTETTREINMTTGQGRQTVRQIR